MSGVIALGASWVSSIANNRAGDVIQIEANHRIADADARGREALAHAAEANAGVAIAHAETAKANAMAALANERVVKANLLLEKERVARLKLEGRLAPRRLSNDQIAKLASVLERGRGSSIQIYWTSSDLESEMYAKDFVRVFQRSGWNVQETPSMTLNQSLTDIRLGVNKEDGEQDVIPLTAEIVANALIESGLSTMPVKMAPSRIPRGHLQLVVGKKRSN